MRKSLKVCAGYSKITPKAFRNKTNKTRHPTQITVLGLRLESLNAPSRHSQYHSLPTGKESHYAPK